jgi:ABC-type oligopeptide transport system substrate-binding subunit
LHIERDKTLIRDIDVKYSFNGKKLAGLILLAFNATVAQAADVPAGAKLAAVQEQVQRYFQQAEAVLAADTPVAPVYYEANATLIKPYVRGSTLPLKVPCTIKTSTFSSTEK